MLTRSMKTELGSNEWKRLCGECVGEGNTQKAPHILPMLFIVYMLGACYICIGLLREVSKGSFAPPAYCQVDWLLFS